MQSLKTALGYSLGLFLLPGVSADGACNLWQTCESNAGKMPGDTLGTCTDPTKVAKPIFIEGGYDPMSISTAGQSAMATSCPFYDKDALLCCSSDNMQVMEANYKQLDAVFAYDCPICASNLKRMWCEYACNPIKANFLAHTGDRPSTSGTDMWPVVTASLDSNYACGIFTSCAKESYIAESGLTSAIAFLDFLGSNGAPYSLSYIEFALIGDSTIDNAMQGEEGVAYQPCEYHVPEDGLIFGYPNNYDTTCSYCDAACQPPVVDDKIAFLDGLSWKIVGYSYLSFVLFTIAFQVLVHMCCQKSQMAKIQSELDRANMDSGETRANGASEASSNGRQGRPVNVTNSSTGLLGSENDYSR